MTSGWVTASEQQDPDLWPSSSKDIGYTVTEYLKKKKKMHLGLQGSVTQGSGLKLTQVINKTMNQSEGKNTAFLLQITY